MGAIEGLSCKVYRNTGSYGSPVWALWQCVRDTTIDITFDEVDATCRGGGGLRQNAVTLTTIEVSGEAIKEKTDTSFVAMELAARNKAIVDVMVLDGAEDVEGTTGWRFDAHITSWSEAQPVEDIVKVSFTLKPARSENVPTFIEIEGE